MKRQSPIYKLTAVFLALSSAAAMGGCSDGGQTEVTGGGTSSASYSAPAENNSGLQTDTPTEAATEAMTEAAAEAATEPTAEPATEAEPTAPSISDYENAELIEGLINCVTYKRGGHWWGVQLYGGGYNRSLYVESVNKFAEDLDGIAKVYSMVAPTNSEFYCPPGYENLNYSQYDDISYIADNLSGKVTNVDCYNVLKQHVNDDIYFRTDHHWKVIGAYYAAEQFAKAAGVPFAELNETNFEKKEIEGFIGSLCSTTGNENLSADPDEFVYYVPANDFKCYYYDMAYNLDGRYPFFLQMDGKNAFGTFMGSDKKIVRVETDVKNGRKLMLIKDSYGNLEIPFYMNSYEEIYVTDVRFFDLNAIDFIKEHKINDVLFTMCSASATGQNCQGIEMMRTGAGHLIDW